MIDFQPFPKIARLSREMVITEKLDGTNAQVIIGEAGEFATASRNRLITPEDDNYGFSAWAYQNKKELLKLGPGRHYGEWWGKGIQRGYGMPYRVFSLFNVKRWQDKPLPECVSLVPVLYRGMFSTHHINAVMDGIRTFGSEAAPGFMRPEGIIVFHTASGHLYKKTFEHDEAGKEAATCLTAA